MPRVLLILLGYCAQHVWADVHVAGNHVSNRTYDECIKSKYSGKFWCSEHDREKSRERKGFSCMNATASFIHFIGDSVMIELKDSYDCLCAGKTTLLGAKGIKAPADKAFEKTLPHVRQGDVVVVGFGLWFSGSKLKAYVKQLRRLRNMFQHAIQAHPWLKIVWVRTVAQHFCTKGGVYKLGATKCCPARNPDTSRQKAVDDNLLRPLQGLIAIYDAFALTKAWHDAHPGEGDCTHLCSEDNGPMQELASKFSAFLHEQTVDNGWEV